MYTTRPRSRTRLTPTSAALRNANHCPAGFYVWPSPASIFVWDCVFFAHQGYYNNSVLKVRLSFPEDYPRRPPAVHFATDVFHPLVSQRDGSFSLNPRFAGGWKPGKHHVYDVLHWIKTSFKRDSLKCVGQPLLAKAAAEASAVCPCCRRRRRALSTNVIY